jgi:hypothetical protein
MFNRKKPKTIAEYSVSQLLDDFLSPITQDTTESSRAMDDEEYIRMMLAKDEMKKLERKRRKATIAAQGIKSKIPNDAVDEVIRQQYFPDMNESLIEKQSQRKVEHRPAKSSKLSMDNDIVEQILDSIAVKDVSGLAAKMKEAVDFVQDEMGTSEAELKLIDALKRYKNPIEPPTKQYSNENILVLKRCQNCYYCVGEQSRIGSVWCRCTNLNRSPEIETEDSWVKAGINFSCWKNQQN